MEEKKKFNVKAFAIILIIAVVLIVTVSYILISGVFEEDDDEGTSRRSSSSREEKEPVPAETPEVAEENEYAVTTNDFSKFDLSFLKFENEEENKIYSPLSIKYAFKMLEEATEGRSYEQIASIINAYNLTEYESNEKMALANAFFIRESFKHNVKDSYINALKTKYNADLVFDEFASANKINSWVKEHTLELIPEITDDSEVKSLNFALVNALGIDMEWEHKFLKHDYADDKNISYGASYYHARIPSQTYAFEWNSPDGLTNKKFNETQNVSSMKVIASINNYDPVKTLGEDAIREEVYEDFKEWATGTGKHSDDWDSGKNYTDFFENDYSEEGIKKAFDKWFNNTNAFWNYEGKSFIEELNENLDRVNYSTDFSIYVDDDVKVFAKDLEEVDGTTLQYVGIMPINEDLDEYIDSVSSTEINKLVSNLKELKQENFRDGYLTYIHGYIPKFKFEYDLDLKSDLEKLGVTDVFEAGKANLSKMTDDKNTYIGVVKHKANIEFTQDGIKAAAATMAGGLGAGMSYDYYLEMPTDDIDITFDKPYMFLIRDKKTGETWFVGTVYEPLDVEDEEADYLDTAWEDIDTYEAY